MKRSVFWALFGLAVLGIGLAIWTAPAKPSPEPIMSRAHTAVSNANCGVTELSNAVRCGLQAWFGNAVSFAGNHWLKLKDVSGKSRVRCTSSGPKNEHLSCSHSRAGPDVSRASLFI